MVANFRCNEIKAEALQLVTSDIEALKSSCENGLFKNFKQKCTSILKTACANFE